MKMAEQKPLTLKVGLVQHRSPTDDLYKAFDDFEEERLEQLQKRMDRISRFILLYGSKKYHENQNAVHCLVDALLSEPPDVWQKFISILGNYTAGDINKCINSAPYRLGQHPMQIALDQIATDWQHIIQTANRLELWRVCTAILDVFDVPHEDTVEANDCSSPTPKLEPINASRMSSLANGKEPEENDDHNNSELSTSPNDEHPWANSNVACAAPQKIEAGQKFNSYSDNNSLPSNNADVKVERGSKALRLQLVTEESFSPPSPLTKQANGVNSPTQDHILLWKRPQTQELASSAASNSFFYSEDKQAVAASQPYSSNPFSQQTPTSVVATTVAVTSGVTTPPPMMAYSQSPIGMYPGIPQNSSMLYMSGVPPYMSFPPYPVCYPVQPQSMPPNTTTAPYPFAHTANMQPFYPSFPVYPAYNAINVNSGHFPNANSEASQQSAAPGTPTAPPVPPAEVQVSTAPVINPVTNPFADSFNVRSSPLNEQTASLPVNSAATNTSTNGVGTTSGSASLPNINRNTMAVFLTHSNDALAEADLMKHKLRQKFPGICVVTHAVLGANNNYTTPEKINRIFYAVDYIIPIISPQYLEDIKAEVAQDSEEAGSIRTLHVKYLDNFHHEGCKNTKVRAFRVKSVTYDCLKKLPSCLSTARGNMDELIGVLYYSRSRAPGQIVS